MKLLSLPMILSLILASLMMFLSLLISKKSFNDQEKLSAFECGFDSQSTPRMNFSLHFFLILIIFLIFDIEITLIIPMISMIKLYNTFNWFMISTTFIFILIFGLYLEWIQNMLKWSN
uniref:NADH-ubiquinone oxidoreductase chain 3 n=1 Tax=Lepidostoma longipilosum TaxID=2904889 RepID=A0A9E8LPP2_9NEOP|nr:NADH dehydrogenase subunit 3 [Lepidostoma longipilosum]UZZ43642.1 NADH dehydrogenase subunit 3 [Lepidostoma longipilosum]